MIKDEFEKSGKKDYLVDYISRANKMLPSDIKKFDWSSTKNSALATKITYNTFRYVIDNSKLNISSRYVAERQLSHLLQRINTQHMFHPVAIIGSQISNQLYNNINLYQTPKQTEKAIFSNINQGDALAQPNPWSNKIEPKSKCKYCNAGTCRIKAHKKRYNRYQ